MLSNNVLSQCRLAPITAQVVRLAGDCHSLVYVPGHQGIPGNEEADRLANLAKNEGVRPREAVVCAPYQVCWLGYWRPIQPGPTHL